MRAPCAGPATQVVAALIGQAGRLLICQRPAHKARGLLWEFPGGKVDPGEGPREALIRECQEELGVTLQVGELYAQVTHPYPDLLVCLRLYRARIVSGEPKKLEHADLRWVRPEDLTQYDFCPADTEIIARLAGEAGGCGNTPPQSKQHEGGQDEALSS
ncbi:MAG: (deoxy)nucleoside triphosphate pyrophosphohydrolase [Clostridiales bacterium]|nr:(deoxy)nucleoside triphosphate pyrophosphohydrolase [Clostridiales bacterium]